MKILYRIPCNTVSGRSYFSWNTRNHEQILVVHSDLKKVLINIYGRKGQLVYIKELKLHGICKYVAWNKDANELAMLISGVHNKLSVSLWSFDQANPVLLAEQSKDRGSITTIAWSKLSNTLAMGFSTGGCLLYDRDSGMEKYIKDSLMDSVRAIDWCDSIDVLTLVGQTNEFSLTTIDNKKGYYRCGIGSGIIRSVKFSFIPHQITSIPSHKVASSMEKQFATFGDRINLTDMEMANSSLIETASFLWISIVDRDRGIIFKPIKINESIFKAKKLHDSGLIEIDNTDFDMSYSLDGKSPIVDYHWLDSRNLLIAHGPGQILIAVIDRPGVSIQPTQFFYVNGEDIAELENRRDTGVMSRQQVRSLQLFTLNGSQNGGDGTSSRIGGVQRDESSPSYTVAIGLPYSVMICDMYATSAGGSSSGSVGFSGFGMVGSDGSANLGGAPIKEVSGFNQAVGGNSGGGQFFQQQQHPTDTSIGNNVYIMEKLDYLNLEENLSKMSQEIESLSWSGDGKLLTIQITDGSVIVFRVRLPSIVLHSCGTRLAYLSEDREVTIIECRQQDSSHSMGLNGGVNRSGFAGGRRCSVQRPGYKVGKSTATTGIDGSGDHDSDHGQDQDQDKNQNHDGEEDDTLINIVNIEVNPTSIAVGPRHLAVVLNNRVWYYMTSRSNLDVALINQRDYVSIVSSIQLNSRMAAVLFTDGRLQLHPIRSYTPFQQQQQHHQQLSSSAYNRNQLELAEGLIGANRIESSSTIDGSGVGGTRGNNSRGEDGFGFLDDETDEEELDRERFFPDPSSARQERIVSLALTESSFIYSTDTGRLVTFSLKQWRTIQTYVHTFGASNDNQQSLGGKSTNITTATSSRQQQQHQQQQVATATGGQSCTTITKIVPNLMGTVLILVDQLGRAFVYNSIDDSLVSFASKSDSYLRFMEDIHPPLDEFTQYQQQQPELPDMNKLKDILWQNNDTSLSYGDTFIVVEETKIHVFVYFFDTFYGPMVSYVSSMSKAISHNVLIFSRGTVSCQTSLGKLFNMILFSHDTDKQLQLLEQSINEIARDSSSSSSYSNWPTAANTTGLEHVGPFGSASSQAGSTYRSDSAATTRQLHQQLNQVNLERQQMILTLKMSFIKTLVKLRDASNLYDTCEYLTTDVAFNPPMASMEVKASTVASPGPPSSSLAGGLALGSDGDRSTMMKTTTTTATGGAVSTSSNKVSSDNQYEDKTRTGNEALWYYLARFALFMMDLQFAERIYRKLGRFDLVECLHYMRRPDLANEFDIKAVIKAQIAMMLANKELAKVKLLQCPMKGPMSSKLVDLLMMESNWDEASRLAKAEDPNKIALIYYRMALDLETSEGANGLADAVDKPDKISATGRAIGSGFGSDSGPMKNQWMALEHYDKAANINKILNRRAAGKSPPVADFRFKNLYYRCLCGMARCCIRLGDFNKAISIVHDRIIPLWRQQQQQQSMTPSTGTSAETTTATALGKEKENNVSESSGADNNDNNNSNETIKLKGYIQDIAQLLKDNNELDKAASILMAIKEYNRAIRYKLMMQQMEELEQQEGCRSIIDLITDQSILFDCSRYFQRTSKPYKAIQVLERLLLLQQSQGNQLLSVNVVLELVTLILNKLNDPTYAMKFARQYKDSEAIKKVESFLDSEQSSTAGRKNDLNQHMRRISGSSSEQNNI